MTTIQRSRVELADLCEDYWRTCLRYSPIEGLTQGQVDARTCFFREGLGDLQQRSLTREAMSRALEHIDTGPLDEQDLISFQMLQRQLSLEIRMEGLDDDLRPNLFPFGPETSLHLAVTSFVAADAESAADYLVRLASLPRSFADFLARYQAGADKGYRLPAVLRSRVLSNIGASFADDPEHSYLLRPLSAGRFAKERDAAIALLKAEVYPALRAYRDGVERLLAASSRDSIGLRDEVDGDRYYAALIDRHTSLQMSPQEIHRLGLDELERIRSELVDVARQAGHGGDVERLRAFARTNPEFTLDSAVELRERIEVLSKRIDALIPAFFSRVPRTTFGVQSIPLNLSANMPPAYAQPAPADRSAAGIHWITSLPEKCPTYMHVPLALHEAWPGHLMHVALLEELEDLPRFRRFGALQHTAYIEGWALYCEGLGVDMGLYDDPYAHFGRLSMDAWRAARLVVDTGIHALGWERERAVTFLEKHQAMGRAAAESEVDRYIGMPGQALSYKLGHSTLRTLRAHAQAQLGPAFSIREFHDALIKDGALPLPLLDEQVRRWIRSRAKS